MKALAVILALALSGAAHAGSIDVAWDMPTNNVDGGACIDVTHCNLYAAPVGVTTGAYTRILTIGAPTNYATVSLPNGLWSLTVTAVGLGGESDKSSNLVVRIGKQPAPGKPGTK